jgi:hypothetical protein
MSLRTTKSKLFAVAALTGSIVMASIGPATQATASSGAPARARLTQTNITPQRTAIDPVTTAADDLEAFLQQHRLLNSGDVDIPAAYNRVVLFWHGSMPAALRHLLDTASWRGLVTIRPARYSPGRLQAAARTAIGAAGVDSTGPSADYAGVVVQFTATARRSAALKSLAHLGVPVTFTTPARPIPADRAGDTAPPIGGDLVKGHPGGKACSLGVTVTWGHTTGITTANHCGVNRWTGFASGARLGTSVTSKHSKPLDVQAISGSRGLPFVQTGAWNGTKIAGVYRGENPPNGVKICTSGGVTGQVCAGTLMRVRTVRTFVKLSGRRVGPGFWLTNIKKSNGSVICVARPGDSGSPTYSFNSNHKVTIYGLLVAVDERLSTINCKGNPHFPVVAPPGAPSFRAFAVNIVQALHAIHVSLARDTG